MQSVLYIDQGNSRTKFWLTHREHMLLEGVIGLGESPPSQLMSATIQHVVIATVKTKRDAEALLQPWLATQPIMTWVHVRPDILATAYEDHTKLGIDRWLAVLAARYLGEGTAIVIDAGTAITIDVLTALGAHAGGYILPGLSMQQASLAAHTARVQFPQADWRSQSLGTNTAAAVGHASLRALCALTRDMLQECGGDEPVRLYLTGGNAGDIAAFLPEAVVVCDLVLVGMKAYVEWLRHIQDEEGV